jgi:hypothetical protein
MQKQRFFSRGLTCLLLVFSFAATSFGAKDYKGLFGSYQRQNFTENEGDSSDFGVDLLLSTLIPVTNIVTSSQDGTNFAPMYYSTFFNVEGSVFFTLNYHWEIFANFGYYNYDTRNLTTAIAQSSPTDPAYHNFTMTAFPMVAGIKYRFSRSDIVPYIGLGAGISFVHRRGYFDNSTLADDDYEQPLTGEVIIGLEFFFSSRAGIRLEASGYYMALPQVPFNPGGVPATTPLMNFVANPISIRYASGVFFLF